MKIHKSSRRILLKELRTETMPQTDMYGIRLFPLNSIKTILDIGANCGFCSVGFRFFQPNARVVAIEPDNYNFKLLTKNVSNLDIETFNIALGPGGEVSKTEGRFSLTHKFLPDRLAVKVTQKCQSLLLNDIIKKYKIDTNKLFIKIDIEGAEQFIFNHLPSEEIIRKSTGTSMEIHNRLPGIFDVPSSIKWANEKFSSTHNIYYNIGKAVHLSLINKSSSNSTNSESSLSRSS